MASNKKWLRRALRALSYGEMDLWNIVKQKLPDERRIYLENKYLPRTPAAPPTTIENKEEPQTTGTSSLKTNAQSEAVVAPKVKTPREKKESKVTKTKTTRQRTKSQTKKTKKTSQGG